MSSWSACHHRDYGTQRGYRCRVAQLRPNTRLRFLTLMTTQCTSQEGLYQHDEQVCGAPQSRMKQYKFSCYQDTLRTQKIGNTLPPCNSTSETHDTLQRPIESLLQRLEALNPKPPKAIVLNPKPSLDLDLRAYGVWGSRVQGLGVKGSGFGG